MRIFYLEFSFTKIGTLSFLSSLYFQCLEESLAHSKCPVNTCRMSEWMNECWLPIPISFVSLSLSLLFPRWSPQSHLSGSLNTLYSNYTLNIYIICLFLLPYEDCRRDIPPPFYREGSRIVERKLDLDSRILTSHVRLHSKYLYNSKQLPKWFLTSISSSAKWR